MEKVTKQRNVIVKDLLNGPDESISHVIPLEMKKSSPERIDSFISISYGVLIGLTGDISGKLVLSGDRLTFASIGQSMFQMEVAGEMLTSFSGELGNMTAGNLSTNIVGKGYEIDITYPSIIEGNSRITGFKQTIKLPFMITSAGTINAYVLLD